MNKQKNRRRIAAEGLYLILSPPPLFSRSLEARRRAAVGS